MLILRSITSKVQAPFVLKFESTASVTYICQEITLLHQPGVQDLQAASLLPEPN
jgi:hypothetical protein